MKKFNSYILLFVLVISALFAGCSSKQDQDDVVIDDSSNTIGQGVPQEVPETPQDAIDEQLVSEEDDVEIGELI